MKKTFIGIFAILTLTLLGCGGKNSNNASNNAPGTEADSTTSEQIDTAALSQASKSSLNLLVSQANKAIQSQDPKQITTSLANLEATYKALVNAGKLDEAKVYGTAIKNYIKQNADAIKAATSGNEVVTNLIKSIENLPTTASATEEDAKKAVTEDIVNLASPYIQKGAAAAATAETAAKVLESMPAKAKSAIESAPEAAKSSIENAAKQTVDNAKNTAQTKINEETSKAATKADEAVKKAQKKTSEKVNNAVKKTNDAINQAAGKALKGIGL